MLVNYRSTTNVGATADKGQLKYYRTKSPSLPNTHFSTTIKKILGFVGYKKLWEKELHFEELNIFHL
jgi:hypothetical protein